jgi:TolB-like protein/Flp pilus assembly protein TadD
MAPEQLRHEEADHRTDIFAFGSVLYEMVTGSRPFTADSYAGIAAAILEHHPEPMADRQPLTPPALSALVNTCFAKDPDGRWQRAQDLVVALTSIANEELHAAASDRGIPKGLRAGVSRARVLAALLTIAALAGVGGWAWVTLERAPSRVALAVLPFENLGSDSERDYVADALTEETSAFLGQVDPERLGVIGRTSTGRYKRTTKSVAEIGKELGVDYVVESSIRAEGDRLRVTAKLIRVPDQIQVWSQSYQRSLTNLLGLEQELSAAVAEQIRLRLSPERQSAIARRQSSNPAAYDLFLRGRALWNQLTPPTTRRAMDYYARATAIDPSYALAWSGMADAFTAGPINGDAPPEQVWPRARDAVAHAIAADPNLAEAQASQGAFRFWLDWNWPAAEESLRRAIALDPNYPFAHQLLGIVLSHMGRHAEAAAAIRRARELDPLSAAYQALSAQVAFHARDYEAAIEFGRQATVIDPEFWVGFNQLAQAYERIGKTELALEATANAERFSGGGNSKALSLRGYLLAKAGKVNEAREVLTALHTAARDRYIPPSATALVHAGLGDREAVFEWLEKAYAVHDVHLAFLPVDPKWDPYRADRRFSALVVRCGFSGAAKPPSLTEGQ